MDFLTNVARRQVEPGTGVRPRWPSGFAIPVPPARDGLDPIETPSEAIAPHQPAERVPLPAATGWAAPRPAVYVGRAPGPRESDRYASTLDRGSRGPMTQRSPVERRSSDVRIVPAVRNPASVESGRRQDSPVMPSGAIASSPDRGRERVRGSGLEATVDQGAPADKPAATDVNRPAAAGPRLVPAGPSSAVVTAAASSLGPVEALRRAPSGLPNVTVTIGRVEVRAVTAPAAPAATPVAGGAARSTAISLDDYLEHRHGATSR